MKLVSRELRIDDKTFQPVARVTFDIPLERVVDDIAIYGEDSFYQRIGEEFAKAIKTAAESKIRKE
jgi:hypothetical protein